jgi:hypothetical protein
MKRVWLFAAVFAVCTAATFSVAAQTGSNSTSVPSLAVQRSAGGIDYISGGVGDEDRAAMSARQAELPFKVVLSNGGGEYIVASKLTLSTPQGELLSVQEAGPIVMMKLAPGQYTLEATWHGKTERRSVRATTAAQTVNWSFKG